MKLHIIIVLCTIICTVQFVHSASIQKRSADIPVQIIYEEPTAAVRNLQDKAKELDSVKPVIAESAQIAEVPTLSDEPLKKAILPITTDEVLPEVPVKKEEKVDFVTPCATEEVTEAVVTNSVVPEIIKEIISEIVKQEITETTPIETPAAPIHALKNLGERPQLSYQQLKDVGKNAPIEKTRIVTGEPNEQVENFNSINYHLNEQNIDDIYEKIQEIVLQGAQKIRANVEKNSDKVDPATKQEIFEKLNSTLDQFLETTKKTIALRGVPLLKQQSTNQNFLQTVVGNLQNATANFMQNFQNTGTSGQSDETTQTNNPVQFVINQIQNGFQQISNNINNVGTPTNQNTVLGDEQTPTSEAPGFNPFQPFIQGGQQVIQNVQGFFNPAGTTSGVQGDDVTTPGNPILNAFQQVQTNLQQFINRPNPGPGTAGDTPATGGNIISNTFQQLQSNVQQFNPFNQPTAAPSGVQGDATTNAPAASNPIINTFQQLQSNFQQFNPFGNREPVVAPAGDTAVVTPAPSNPVLNAIQSVSSGIQSAIPTAATPDTAGNVAQPIISAVQQAGQTISELVPTGTPAVIGDLPSPAAVIENLQTNVNQVVSGDNPVQQAVQAVIPSSTAAPAGPLQSIVQNVQNLNPFRRRSTTKPSVDAVTVPETTDKPASPVAVVAENNEVTEVPVKIEKVEDDNKVTSD